MVNQQDLEVVSDSYNIMDKRTANKLHIQGHEIPGNIFLQTILGGNLPIKAQDSL